MEISEIPKYVRDNLSEEITISKLAKLCYHSTTSLKLKTIEVFGESIGKIIIKHKMYAAHEMLVSGNYRTVKSVANSVGYIGLSNFAATFKTVFGYSPKQVHIMPRLPQEKESSINLMMKKVAILYIDCPHELKDAFEEYFGVPIISFLRLSS